MLVLPCFRRVLEHNVRGQGRCCMGAGIVCPGAWDTESSLGSEGRARGGLLDTALKVNT